MDNRVSEDVASADPLLLDTQIWIWAANGASDRVGGHLPELLSHAALEGRVRLSAVSVWEAAHAIVRGRVVVRGTVEGWIERAVTAFGGHVWSLDRHVALESVRLPALSHRDPGDRFLIATARLRGARLVTTDREILSYGAAGHLAVLDARPSR